MQVRYEIMRERDEREERTYRFGSILFLSLGTVYSYSTTLSLGCSSVADPKNAGRWYRGVGRYRGDTIVLGKGGSRRGEKRG